MEHDIISALADVSKKHGVDIRFGSGGKYNETNASLKLEISCVQGDGTVITKEADAFKRHAYLYGFKPEDLGREFVSGGKRYKISGLNTKAHKMPVLATEVGTNRVFKFSEAIVLNRLGDTPESSREVPAFDFENKSVRETV